MIKIKDLTKSFDGVEVLSHISMTLESGKIYGLVGRNGSGKTMLMKHILGFVSPTSGSITIDGKVLGKDIDAPDNIGAIIENPGLSKSEKEGELYKFEVLRLSQFEDACINSS